MGASAVIRRQATPGKTKQLLFAKEPSLPAHVMSEGQAHPSLTKFKGSSHSVMCWTYQLRESSQPLRSN